MSLSEFIIKLSEEGREWAKILIPVFFAWLHGLYTTPPKDKPKL